MALRIRPLKAREFAYQLVDKLSTYYATTAQFEGFVKAIEERDAQIEASVNLAVGGTE